MEYSSALKRKAVVSDTWYNINQPWKYVKWNKLVTEEKILYGPTDMRYLVVRFIEAERILVARGAWGFTI